MTKCSACSSEVIGDERYLGAPIGKCTGCGGLITLAPIEYTKICGVVGLDRPMGRGDNETYFDVDAIHRQGVVRYHGWFDKKTGIVTQIG